MSFDHGIALKEIANGDESALSCLNTLFDWVHAFDDILDRDKPVLLPWPVLANLRALECAASNAFFQKHKATLLPILQTSALSYLASERFKTHPEPIYRIASQVLKSSYQDLFFAVARITGGEEFMIQMDAKYRGVDADPCPAPDAIPKNETEK